MFAPVAGQVVRLRFILGLSVDQTAEALGVSASTVKKKWKYGKAWLLHRLDSQVSGDADVN